MISKKLTILFPPHVTPILCDRLFGFFLDMVCFFCLFFTFSGTVHRLVVPSFGHLEHPCSHQVFVGAVCWCVTPASLNTKQEQTHEHSTQPHLQTQLAFRATKIKPTQLELLKR